MGSRLLHETETRTQDNTHNNTIITQTRTQHKKYESHLEEYLQIFNDSVSSIAYQYWYVHVVYNLVQRFCFQCRTHQMKTK